MSPNRKPEIKFTKLFINNEYVNAVSGKTFETINPATGEVICRVQEGDKSDVDKAVTAARNAFKRNSVWRTMDASERGRHLLKLAELIERDADYIASLETLGSGKPIVNTRDEVKKSHDILKYNAGLADKIHGKTIPMDGKYWGLTRLEPIGVVGVILPSNKPFFTLTLKLAQSLAAGNTLVVKPAEQTPLTALYMGSLLIEAGIPSGVVNILPGFGPTAGNAIASHMNVDMITFNGSTEAGKSVQSAAGQSNCKRVSTVMSGKSPLVVFDDANLDLAVQKAHLGVFANQGQNRAASGRVFVHETLYDQFVRKSVELASKRVVGDPFDEKTQQGSQVDSIHFDRVMSLIETGKREGAKLMFGGHRVGNKGFFIQPTIFSDVTDNMTIAREEIYGPVMSVLRFRDKDEVIDRCNNSNYGIAAGVFTHDLDKALEFGQAVEAGYVYVNNYMAYGPQTPFGGRKQSGNGRMNGEDGLHEYLQIKSMAIRVEQKQS